MKGSDIHRAYDVVVAGGGVTGAGIFHAAVKKGYRVLLLESKDFAWGTSSRSSKMVHGGLRYLKQGKFLLTRAAVKERERLLKTYPGLVTPLKFIMPVFDHYGPSPGAMKIGLSIYSLMAKKKQHKIYTRAETVEKIPGIRTQDLLSAVGFKDAQVDDARLVLRLIYDGCRLGGTALNYTKVSGIQRDGKGRLAAVEAMDTETLNSMEIQTKVLINATGVFAETLHPSPKKGFHIRPLRGSHLVFPGTLFPLDRVISFIHPQDLRPVFLFPWEGAMLLGTTDVDYDEALETEPRVSMKEAHYLLEGLAHVLPGLDIALDDCIASIAGIRPVLSRKKVSASKESREHVIWEDKGLITVTGGKLTTFQMLAHDALKAAGPYLQRPEIPTPGKGHGQPGEGPDTKTLHRLPERLSGRYGAPGVQVIQQYDDALFRPIGETTSIWAELCYAAGHETIRHLSDLLLRRVRIGLFLSQGGKSLLDRIETVCTPCLDWDSPRWEKEKKDYIRLWETYYGPPGKTGRN